MGTITLTKDVETHRIPLNGTKKIEVNINKGKSYKYCLSFITESRTYTDVIIKKSSIIDIDKLDISFKPSYIRFLFDTEPCIITYRLL